MRRLGGNFLLKASATGLTKVLGLTALGIITLLGCGEHIVIVEEGSRDSAVDAPKAHEAGPSPGQETTATKVDLLFDIDNSASMDDKQVYLEQAVPELINRLLDPNCVEASSGRVAGPSVHGSCASFPGTSLEFLPMHDMHIGVLSSSLGTRGVTGSGAVCLPDQMTNQGMPFLDGKPALPSHTDDRGELLDRTSQNLETEGTSAVEGAQHFLDWFPNVAANAGKTPTGDRVATLSPVATPLTEGSTLESDFQALLFGVHSYGCGIESQIESWYRFLVQPDPYDSISTAGGVATLNEVDGTIIRQRHDFLRPDSLVAIIALTDENDSEIDVRSFQGQGFAFMDANRTLPRGTSACNTNPASPDCTSCAYAGHENDSSCRMGKYQAETDWGFYINVRHVHMKAKYGIVPQFPLQRYVLGLSSTKVPDRDHEYPAGAANYMGGTSGDPSDLNCTNPLFASSLPDGSDLSADALCNAAGAGGPRAPSLVFYAHIGGVPHQLLQVDPDNPDSPQKDTLSATDWQTILGQNPDTYDYSGIDPHMIESFTPRTGVSVLSMGPNASGGGSDPINGGDWVTDTATPLHALPVDREYACIFPLAKPRDCSNPEDYVNQIACDCSISGLPLSAVPSVCGLSDPSKPYVMGINDYTKQYYAKAYPTTRELELAQLLGTQGVISSLCPIHVKDNSNGNDPLFGYRPAVTALVTRMKTAL
jgi:hypothetical protein